MKAFAMVASAAAFLSLSACGEKEEPKKEVVTLPSVKVACVNKDDITISLTSNPNTGSLSLDLAKGIYTTTETVTADGQYQSTHIGPVVELADEKKVAGAKVCEYHKTTTKKAYDADIAAYKQCKTDNDAAAKAAASAPVKKIDRTILITRFDSACAGQKLTGSAAEVVQNNAAFKPAPAPAN